MPYYVRSKTNDRILLILAALFVMTTYFLATVGSGMYVLFAIIILFLVISNYKLEFHAFHVFIFQFCLYCYANSMWALNYHNAISNGNTILYLLICLSIMYCHFKKFNDVTQLMKLIMWVGYIVVFYCYLFYGVERVTDLASEEGRLSNSFNNINTLSMLASTVLIINMFFILFIVVLFEILEEQREKPFAFNEVCRDCLGVFYHHFAFFVDIRHGRCYQQNDGLSCTIY